MDAPRPVAIVDSAARRWRRIGVGWDARGTQLLGPRPPLALLAGVLYALVGLLLAAFGVIDTVMDWRRGGWEPLGFCGPIAIYCAGLAYGSVRLRSRSMGVPASAWVCAPLLLHGVSGLLGALVPVLYAIGMEPRSFKEPLTDAAMFGVLLGCLPAMVPFLCARRGGLLLGAAVAGPLVLLVAIPFVHIHL